MALKPASGFFGGVESNIKKIIARPDERAQGNRAADFRPTRREM